jgi:isopenicillin N synthase-like dioxygenase
MANISQIPIIDISSLVLGHEPDAVAAQIRQACCSTGFFYVVGHGIDEALQQRLEQLSRQFFAQDLETKQQIRMALGGRAWRGYFSIGGELTSGQPDLKEGIYFGTELSESHPTVQAGVPMHGANLFPEMPQFRETVLAYLEAMTQLGHTLMTGIALSLGLEAAYFYDRYTNDPLILFRIFNYPSDASSPFWGVGEHTDYGLLTILKQDDSGGLQVKSKSGWIDAPPIANSFVCNIGDMLDRLTGGLYRSTSHRVRNISGRDRLSFPFFFDPNFNAELHPIELRGVMIEDDKDQRWDGASVHQFQGTYGDYVLNKVAKVFPELRQQVSLSE